MGLTWSLYGSKFLNKNRIKKIKKEVKNRGRFFVTNTVAGGAATLFLISKSIGGVLRYI
jgi:hypothetical protein